MDRAAKLSIAEVVVVVGLIAVFLWFGRRAFPGVNAAFAVMLLALLVYSHWQAGEGWREIGFRLDTLWPASRLLIPLALGAGAIVWIASIVLRDFGPPSGTVPTRIGQFIAFGLAQQYVMLGFILRRLDRVADARSSLAITAVLFALLHLPNLFLTAVTLVWGVISCLVYRRWPNLWVNGVTHGLLASLLYYVLPRAVTHALRVGTAYV